MNSPQKGLWRGTLMVSLICAWTNGWVNIREAGGLIRHRAHYDVAATFSWFFLYMNTWCTLDLPRIKNICSQMNEIWIVIICVRGHNTRAHWQRLSGLLMFTGLLYAVLWQVVFDKTKSFRTRSNDVKRNIEQHFDRCVRALNVSIS